MYKIGIDARIYGHLQTGIGNYTKFLIKSLCSITETSIPETKSREIKFFIFLRKKEFNKFKTTNKNFIKVLADYKWYSFAEQTKFPFLLYKYKLDIMHFTHFNVPIFYKKPFIVTIHDLTPKFFPGPLAGKYWHRRFAYNLTIKNAIDKSLFIITPSEFTKNDILKHYKTNANKIKVIYEGTDHISKYKIKNLNYSSNFKFQISNYILYLGVIRPHKNLVKLIQAFKILQNNNFKSYKLILAGPDNQIYPELKKEIKKLKLENNIIITGNLSEKNKINILKHARLVVIPSLYEGFGLVPLEALKIKTAVAVSNIPTFKEILKDSAFFFNPENEKDIARVIKNALNNTKEQNKKINKSKELLKKYKWNKMAKKIFALYLKI